MKLVKKKHIGEINVHHYYETELVIEIDGVEKEYFITHESDYNSSKLEIYHNRKEIKDEKIHDFIQENYDEIGFEEEVGDDDWVEL
jgi:hypothetical protein|tara:strand:+ start:47 stop:304 length:258 start_codon:yes stop_codon:yes gene_type:complete